MKSQKLECHKPGFFALLATHLIGAGNDNLFKTTVSLLVLSKLLDEPGGLLYLSATAALFILPYILFSGFAGYLSDRYSKRTLIIVLKCTELLVMSCALVAFAYETYIGLIAIVFLMGTQSALLSPSKYAFLPEILPSTELSRGNGYLEMVTFVGIIFGTAAAGFLFAVELNPGFFNIALSLLGLALAFFIPVALHSGSSEQAKFSLSPITPHVRALKEIFTSHHLTLAVLGLMLFWSVGALFQLNILFFANADLELSEARTSIILALLGLGIGIGSVVAGKASAGKIELGLVPIGSTGLTVLCIALGVIPSGFLAAAILIFALGLSGGFFSVPVKAFLQAQSPPSKRGSYIAASNFLSFSGMFFVSVLFWVFTEPLELGAQHLFVMMGIVTFAVSLYLYRLMPVMLLRAINWFALHTFYKIDVQGAENVPEDSGVLLVSNHVSFVDAQLLLAAVPRNVHFIMLRRIFEHPLVYPFARTMGALPIASTDGKERIADTLSQARKLIEQGRAVGIFAEGRITSTGDIAPFRSGLESIMKDLNEPIVPVYIGDMWGSIFSRQKRRFRFLPRKLPFPLRIHFGKPMPAHSTAAEVEQVVRKLALGKKAEV